MVGTFTEATYAAAAKAGTGSVAFPIGAFYWGESETTCPRAVAFAASVLLAFGAAKTGFSSATFEASVLFAAGAATYWATAVLFVAGAAADAFWAATEEDFFASSLFAFAFSFIC